MLFRKAGKSESFLFVEWCHQRDVWDGKQGRQAILQNQQSTIENIPEKNDFHTLFEAQKAAFLENPMPDAKKRIQDLKQLKRALLKYRDDIAHAIHTDFGHRSKDETILAEIFTSIKTLDYAAKKVNKWMKPSRRMPGLFFLPSWAKIYYQPLGVVGIIVPWNYPLYLMIGPLAGVISAGNRALIRMSRFSPALSRLLKMLLQEVYDTDPVSLFAGDEVSGSDFTSVPWDHLVFTGSTRVGRQVMRAAADHLVPVTLELGGKSPAIISDHVPMKDAAERIAWGKLLNSGQTCISPDYLFCPENRVDEFTRAFKTAVGRMYGSFKTNPDYTGIQNDDQYNHLKTLLEDAEEKRATIIEINPNHEDFSDIRKLPPYLVLDATEDMLVMQKEIFGPILPILTYKKLKEVTGYINSRPRPLALYFFDYNYKNAEYILKNTHSGGAVINDTIVHVGQENLPFGGIGASGMGQYHGYEGFLTFSKSKSVLFKPGFNSGRFLYPPYKGRIHRFFYKLMLR